MDDLSKTYCFGCHQSKEECVCFKEMEFFREIRIIIMRAVHERLKLNPASKISRFVLPMAMTSLARSVAIDLFHVDDQELVLEELSKGLREGFLEDGEI